MSMGGTRETAAMIAMAEILKMEISIKKLAVTRGRGGARDQGREEEEGPADYKCNRN
jgi:hypothetical protein